MNDFVVERHPITDKKVKRQLTDVEQSARDVENAPSHYSPLEKWRFHAMVESIGTRQKIIDAIKANYTGIEKHAILSRFKHSQWYRRDNPLIDLIGIAVGLTSDQIDDAWMVAAGLPE